WKCHERRACRRPGAWRALPERPVLNPEARTSRLCLRGFVLGFTLSVAYGLHPPKAEGAGQLKAVRFAPHGDYTRVVLDLDERVDYSQGRLSAPERLYLDLFETQPGPALRNRSMAVKDALVSLIHVAQTQAGVTRVVLDLKATADPTVFWMDS